MLLSEGIVVAIWEFGCGQEGMVVAMKKVANREWMWLSYRMVVNAVYESLVWLCEGWVRLSG